MWYKVCAEKMLIWIEKGAGFRLGSSARGVAAERLLTSG